VAEPTYCRCGLLIVPNPGTYPESVEWVHEQSAVGRFNRYCALASSATATPRIRPAQPEGDDA
jgi:hypothetical protein